MALTATIHHLKLAVSDVDRGVYESLDLRIAQHPSESLRYLYARTLAYCLFYEEGIAFSKGLSTTDEPAVWVKNLRGDLVAWIDVGNPSAERLHKASKTGARVVVFTHHNPELLKKAATERAIHKVSAIEVYAIPPDLLDALASVTGTRDAWEIVHTGGQLYVTAHAKVYEAEISRHRLGGD